MKVKAKIACKDRYVGCPIGPEVTTEYRDLDMDELGVRYTVRSKGVGERWRPGMDLVRKGPFSVTYFIPWSSIGFLELAPVPDEPAQPVAEVKGKK